MPDITGEAIDKICTIEAKNRGMPTNILAPMYEAARKLTGGRPISMVAAEKLLGAIGKGDTVLVLTGAGLKPILPEGENDGPPGFPFCLNNVPRSTSSADVCTGPLKAPICVC